MRKAEKNTFVRTGKIETLERREVMSADPLGGLLGPPIEHHDSVVESPAIEHHLDSTPDFWIDPDVDYSIDDTLERVEQTLASAHLSTGLNQVLADYGFTGAGQTVAIIDSGIAYDHYALGGGLGANYRVVGGWDFTENDADPYDDGPAGSHGTHVAGIVGGDADPDHGVATGVDLVGLRVFDDSGAGYFSWVESALQWIHDNRNTFENPITAINLSLGVSGWNSTSPPSWSTLEDNFQQLENDGIFIAVSAGNSYATYNAPGLGYPAASPYVVPVMAVTDAGDLAGFSQRYTTAIGAPGVGIRSTVPDYKGNNNGVTDDYAVYSGTSMAAPYIAGSSVLIREAMEFVGYTNITQDMIYNQMMSTATSFYDSASGQTYKRINMEAAIDDLMPADDYGSTLGSAFNLGTLSGSTTRDGVISTLNDVDYFQFTAGSNGTVTFDATTTTHNLVAAWSVSGSTGSISGSNGETFSFDVVAGQTYTVGLASSNGLGYYTLDISAQNSFTYVDWGLVSFSQKTGLAVSGESWYRVQASQAGYLTVESMYSSQGGQVNLQLYNGNMQLVTSGNGSAGTARVDAYATAGQEYFLRVLGTNSSVDYRLSNLVSVSGTTVTIGGTAGDDTFGFTAGDTHQISVNGVTHAFSSAAANNFVFAGGAGSDTITVNGSSTDETITLRVGSTEVDGTTYHLAATSTETVWAFGNGGNDTALLYDSAGDDLYRQWSTHCVLSGNGFYNYARGFETSLTYASTGVDRAILYDSAGDDLFRSWNDHNVFSGTGFYNYIRSFDDVQAYATQGNDRAVFYDSAGNDTFRSWFDRSQMTYSNQSSYAKSFDQVEAYATQGNDEAFFYDSAGDDLYRAQFDRAQMSGTGFFNYSKGFDNTYAYATVGSDRADFFDSPGDDLFRAWPTHAICSGTGFSNYANGFDQAYAHASNGNDRAVFYDSAGNDTYIAWPNQALMTGTDYYNFVESFDQVEAYASTGTDVAYFYDSVGNDTHRSWYDRAMTSGIGYLIYGRGFDQMTAYSTGGNDLAFLSDSPGNDSLSIRSWGVSLSGNSTYREVRDFNTINAYSTLGGNDTVDITANDYIFNLIGSWT